MEPITKSLSVVCLFIFIYVFLAVMTFYAILFPQMTLYAEIRYEVI